jgi:hypothetical protein
MSFENEVSSNTRGSKKKHTRTGKPKVRTGCITCKCVPYICPGDTNRGIYVYSFAGIVELNVMKANQHVLGNAFPLSDTQSECICAWPTNVFRGLFLDAQIPGDIATGT